MSAGMGDPKCSRHLEFLTFLVLGILTGQAVGPSCIAFGYRACTNFTLRYMCLFGAS